MNAQQHNGGHFSDYTGILAGQSGTLHHESEVSAAAYVRTQVRHDVSLLEEESIISYAMSSNSRPAPISRAPHVRNVTKPLYGKPSKAKSPRKHKTYYGPYDRPPSKQENVIYNPDDFFSADVKPLKKDNYNSINELYKSLEKAQSYRVIDEDGVSHYHKDSPAAYLQDVKQKSVITTQHVLMELEHAPTTYSQFGIGDHNDALSELGQSVVSMGNMGYMGSAGGLPSALRALPMQGGVVEEPSLYTMVDESVINPQSNIASSIYDGGVSPSGLLPTVGVSNDSSKTSHSNTISDEKAKDPQLESMLLEAKNIREEISAMNVAKDGTDAGAEASVAAAANQKFKRVMNKLIPLESPRNAQLVEEKEAGKAPEKMMETRIREIFDNTDKNHDGSLNAREVILGLRNDSELAEFLHLPQHIRQEDGSRDEFELTFQGMDSLNVRELSFDDFYTYILLHREKRKRELDAMASSTDSSIGVATAASVATAGFLSPRKGDPESVEDQSMAPLQLASTIDDRNFLVVSGVISSQNRTISYAIREFYGTCFSITFLVQNTGQTWLVFVPASNTLTYLLRLWTASPKPQNSVMLGDWMLKSTTLNFQNNEITETNFDIKAFHAKCEKETLRVILSATLKIQTLWRRWRAVHHFQAAIHQRIKVQQGLDVASVRTAVRNIVTAKQAVENGTAVRIQTNLRGATISPTKTVLTINPRHATEAYLEEVGSKIAALYHGHKVSPDSLFGGQSTMLDDAFSQSVNSPRKDITQNLENATTLCISPSQSPKLSQPSLSIMNTPSFISSIASVKTVSTAKAIPSSTLLLKENSIDSEQSCVDSRHNYLKPLADEDKSGGPSSDKLSRTTVQGGFDPASRKGVSLMGAKNRQEMAEQQAQLHELKNDVGQIVDEMQNEFKEIKSKLALNLKVAQSSALGHPLKVGSMSTFYGEMPEKSRRAGVSKKTKEEVQNEVTKDGAEVQQLRDVIDTMNTRLGQLETQLTVVQEHTARLAESSSDDDSSVAKSLEGGETQVSGAKYTDLGGKAEIVANPPAGSTSSNVAHGHDG